MNQLEHLSDDLGGETWEIMQVFVVSFLASRDPSDQNQQTKNTIKDEETNQYIDVCPSLILMKSSLDHHISSREHTRLVLLIEPYQTP